MPQTCIMNACDERGMDSEDFGARIAEIEVAVEKIWLSDVLGARL
jgi:hypothetical protein